MNRGTVIAHTPSAMPEEQTGGAADGQEKVRGWDVALSFGVTYGVMLWGVGARAYWGDEADTVSAVSRSLPELMRLLGHVDAVHGLYYILMWPLARVWGTGEIAMRMPSVVAMAAAAAGVTVIGRRLVSRRAGVYAGLVFAVLPMVTVQGHNARPYAMVTAVAVLASWLLLRAAAATRAWWWLGYAISLVLLGYLELLALSLVLAHAVTLAALRGRSRGTVRWWWGAVLAACTAVVPEVRWGWVQRAQIGWIQRPGWADIGNLISGLAAGSTGSAAVIGLLTAAAARRDKEGRARAGVLGWLAVPWLVLPPMVLLLVSEAVPVYNFRYVTFCLPAVALLAGAGLASLGTAWGAAALVLVVALAAPTQFGLRAPGDNLRAAVQLLSRSEHPGDAVIYPCGGIPPWYLAYPRVFGELRNIGMARSGALTGRLYGTAVIRAVLLAREREISRIWALETGPGLCDPAPHIAPGFRLVGRWRPDQGPITLWLYQRR